MLVKADIWAAGMARDGNSAHSRNLVDQLLRVEPDVGEIESPEDVIVDAVHQHVAVVGFDLRSAQHHDAVLVFEMAIVGGAIELAMLRKDDSVERALGAPE